MDDPALTFILYHSCGKTILIRDFFFVFLLLVASSSSLSPTLMLLLFSLAHIHLLVSKIHLKIKTCRIFVSFDYYLHLFSAKYVFFLWRKKNDCIDKSMKTYIYVYEEEAKRSNARHDCKGEDTSIKCEICAMEQVYSMPFYCDMRVFILSEMMNELIIIQNFIVRPVSH